VGSFVASLSGKTKLKSPFPEMGEFPTDELRFHPAAFSLAQCTLFNWDPIEKCKVYCPDFRFYCPNEGCGDAMQCKGWGKNARPEQSLSPDSRVVRSKEYSCPTCVAPNQKSRNALDPLMMSQVPGLVRDMFPFECIPGGSVVSKATVMAIVCGATTNFAFEAMEKQGKEAITAVFLDAEMTRRDVFSTLGGMSTMHTVPDVLPGGTVVDYVKCFALTAPVMKKLFLRHMFKQTPYAEKVFMLNSTETDMLCLDMVHFNGRKGSKGGVFGMWVVLGKFGAPICVRTAMTKSLGDAKSMLEGIQNFGNKPPNYYYSVCTDFPEADEGTVHEMLGPLVKAIKDTFHLRKSLNGTTIDASKFKLGFEDALAGVFWCFSSGDIAKDRARRRIETDDTEAYMDKLYNCPSWLMRNTAIKHMLRVAEEIYTRLRQVLADYQLTGVFKADGYKTHESSLKTILKHVMEPCLTERVVNIGTEEHPHYRYAGGTNLVECLNRLFNAVHLERFGEEMADALVVGVSARFDHTEQRLFRR
jgi:hypothetical protein